MFASNHSQKLPILPGVEFAASLLPVSQIGGDFYAFQAVPAGLVLIMGDVAGKGPTAAHLAGEIRAAFYSQAAYYSQPVELLQAIRRLVMPALEGADSFVTIFLTIIEQAPLRLVYTSAGHTATLLWRADKQDVLQLRSTGLPLGVTKSADLQQQALAFNPGDVLLLYTDGITEALNKDGRVLGLQALVDLLYAAHPTPAAHQCELILQAVEYHRGNTPLHDDLSLFICRSLPGVGALKVEAIPFVYPALIAQVRELARFVCARAEKIIFPSVAVREKFIHELELAVTEIATNIIEHAYQETTYQGRIQGRLMVWPTGISIDLIDSGQPYKPGNTAEFFLPDNPPLRGYGLLIARQLLDTCRYQRLPGRRNHWLLKKELASEQEKQYGYSY